MCKTTSIVASLRAHLYEEIPNINDSLSNMRYKPFDSLTKGSNRNNSRNDFELLHDDSQSPKYVFMKICCPITQFLF